MIQRNLITEGGRVVTELIPETAEDMKRLSEMVVDNIIAPDDHRLAFYRKPK